jgi:hypothetical protein
MNTLSRIVLLPLPLLLAGVARADFNSAYVGADAQWVVSVDFNELRNSTLGKELISFARSQAIVQKSSDGQQTPIIPIAGSLSLNFDKISETLISATSYGANFSKDVRQVDGALVLQGTSDLRKILEAVALQATLTVPDQVKEVTDLPFPAYAIGGEVFVAFPTEPVIIASKSKARLVKARDVVRGAAPSLATSTSALSSLVANPGNTIFLAASVAPADGFFPANQPQTRMLQLVSSGMMSLSEESPRTISHLRLVGSSDESADKLVKIVQGMVAMGSLTETTDLDLKAFLQSSTVEKAGRTVTMNLAYSSERLLDMMHNVEKQGKAVVAISTAVPVPPAAGQLVGEWTLDQAAAGSAPGAALLAEHTIENVTLAYGATITLSARRDRTGPAVIDNVEIFPASGAGAPLRFEAENMRLRGYRTQNAAYASRGRMISLVGSTGTAQFEFPGEDGSYRLVVHYMEQTAGKTAITVSVKNPEAAPAEK